MTEPPTGTLPRWLKPVNKVFVALQRIGLKLGGMYVLTVPGRRSGKPRSTPISLMEFEPSGTSSGVSPARTGSRTPVLRVKERWRAGGAVSR